MNRIQPGLNQSDRIGLTVFGSSLAHLVLILGISFVAPQGIPELEDLPILDIVLVNSQSKETPEEVDFLAQANQEGGGESERAHRPSSPLPMSSGVPGRPLNTGPETTRGTRQELVVANLDTLTVESEKPNVVLPESKPETEQAVEVQPNPTAAPVSEANRLSAELREMLEAYQKRPRRKFLSARTKESKYAEYMEAWRNKVERVGNQNYPQEARDRRLSGNLILDVAIKPNGVLDGVTVARASGHPVLDEAAIQIVKMSAPFEPFPASIASEVDVLHITRTWEFLRDYKLTSR